MLLCRLDSLSLLTPLEAVAVADALSIGSRQRERAASRGRSSGHFTVLLSEFMSNVGHHLLSGASSGFAATLILQPRKFSLLLPSPKSDPISS